MNITERNYVIYKHTSPSGKAYIGQTKNYNARCSRHKGCRPNECTAFYNAIKKYGWDTFQHEILFEGLTLIESNSLEEWCIREHNTLYPTGYNIRHGGSNCTLSEETKRKIGEKSKGRPSATKGKSPSLETRQKMSETRKGRKNPKNAISRKGHKQSPETIEKRAAKQRGRLCPEHVKQIASDTHKGKIVSDETKAKQSAARMGRRLSPESIIKREATKKANREAKLIASQQD
jgi:group I intron endonuclease